MEFNITNVEVFGFEETIRASGLPMKTNLSSIEQSESDVNRFCKLGQAKSGSGHDCALKGITVQMDITAPHYWWPQFQRYHFADIISSQSKMHRIMKFDIESQCNEYVKPEIINIIENLVILYKQEPTKERFLDVISNLPMGFQLTARITTNYLQLKSMYIQRRNHKLPEWHTFCDWVETLPHMDNILMPLKLNE